MKGDEGSAEGERMGRESKVAMGHERNRESKKSGRVIMKGSYKERKLEKEKRVEKTNVGNHFHICKDRITYGPFYISPVLGLPFGLPVNEKSNPAP